MQASVVRPSTFSNDISSEAIMSILSILHIYHLYVGDEYLGFCSYLIRTVVAMATYSSQEQWN